MTKNILILAGDGIGPEVTEQAEIVLKKLSSKINLEVTKGYIGGAAYDKLGNPYPVETQALAEKANAILLGAVGGYKWDNVESALRPEKGLLAIRKHLNLFANIRPAVVFPELADASTLKQEIVAGLDIVIVRELTGGIYFGKPNGIETLPDGQKRGFSTEVYTTSEIERIAKVAFDFARLRGKKVCSVDKANVLAASELWREVVIETHKQYQDVELSHMYVDNAAMQLVRNPKQFDVMLTNNIFGDILSDCAAQLTGSLGMLPSASLAEKGKGALYEPIHGSAPDIAGKNIANPIATILSLAMMFKYSFEMIEVYDSINQAVKSVLAEGYRTADIMQDGMTKLSTSEMGAKIAEKL